MATLAGQTILIVGASSGIGAQVARDVAGHGISEKHAARHVVRALRREPANAAFPWTAATLVRLLRVLPASVSGALLRKLAR
jgi:NAD(P)-dependent dehydrogenase (short-subunit alcohol dehydrogenase family)